MADNNFILHSFVSAKSNGPDTTLVRPSDWNDGHALAGGINGQIIMYDNTQDNNIAWVDGPSLQSGSASSGATGSPYNTSTLVTLNPTGNAIAILMPNLYVITSGGASYTFELKSNSVTILNIVTVNSGAQFGYPHAFNFAAGSKALSVTLTASSGTFTSITLNIYAYMIGKL